MDEFLKEHGITVEDGPADNRDQYGTPYEAFLVHGPGYMREELIRYLQGRTRIIQRVPYKETGDGDCRWRITAYHRGGVDDHRS